MNRPSKRIMLAAAVLGIATLGALRTVFPADATGDALAVVASSQASEITTVNDLARSAMVTDQQLGMSAKLLAGYGGKLQPMPDLGPQKRATPVGAVYAAVEVAEARTRSDAAIKQEFPHGKADLVAREQRTLGNVLQAAADENQRLLGSGISSFEVTSTTISGDQATVVGKATAWSQFEMREQDGGWIASSPSSDVDFSIELDKSADGTWSVTDMTMDFAGGTGP